MMPLDFGRAIDIAAAAAGLSIVELADKAALQRSHVNRIRSGEPVRAGRGVLPSLLTLSKLADAAGVPLSRLIFWAEGGL